MAHQIITSLADLPTSLDGLIATDLETNDPGLKIKGPGWCFPKPDGFIIGFGVYTPQFSCYLPVGHTEGNLELDPVVRWYDEVVAKSDNDKVFANASYDVGWCRTVGIKNWGGRLHDVLVQAPLLDEHRYSYDLDNLSQEKLPGAPRKMNDELEEAATALGIKKNQVKSNLRRISPKIVGDYCIQDCFLTYDLWVLQDKEIEFQDLRETYELETDLIRMLVEMRAKGVRVDQDRADEYINAKTFKMRVPQKDGSLAEMEFEGILSQENRFVKTIKDATGITLESCWNAGELTEVTRALGFEPPLTPKTRKPSPSNEWLDSLKHPVCDEIRALRKINKIRTKFIEGDILEGAVDGRLYGSFNPLKSDEGGTISGRFSSSRPNLQQIPGRDPVFGPLVRSLYLPEVGCIWSSMDFSQQEPRGMTAMAFRSKILSSYAWRQRYIEDPKTDFHDMASEFTGVPRKGAKELGLGIAYAMGSGKLAVKLGLPTEIIEIRDRKTGKMKQLEVGGPEAMAIMNRFNKEAGFIKDLSKLCVKTAKKRGWIRTPGGRRFRFPFKDGENYKSHKALNALIQGMAADETKIAMRNMYRDHGILPAMTIHDELAVTTFENPEQARPAIICMLSALPKPVPSRVDLEVGPSWGEFQKVDLPDLPVIYTET